MKVPDTFITRELYYQAFKEYDEHQTLKTMEAIVGRALTQSYHKRLAYMEDKRIITLKEYSKTSQDSYSNLLNKADRQTIEAFQEKGVWKIGLHAVVLRKSSPGKNTGVVLMSLSVII